jgi:hypothetical protein
MLSKVCNNTHPLKIKLEVGDSLFLGLALKLAFYSSLSSRVINSSDPRNRVLSICMPTIPKVWLVVINRQGSYVDVTMDSFSLWCL